LGYRWNYYFISNTHWDVYAGIGGGVAIDLLKSSTNDPAQTKTTDLGLPIYFSLSAGGRYYFSNKWGVYVEAGLDDGALAQIGIWLLLTPNKITHY